MSKKKRNKPEDMTTPEAEAMEGGNAETPEPSVETASGNEPSTETASGNQPPPEAIE